MKNICCRSLCVLISLVLFLSTESAAQTITSKASACIAPAQDTVPSKIIEFSKDDGFDLQVRADGDSVTVRVTGDVVVVDKNRLASLVADAGAAKTRLSTLVIDARVIEIKGPLSFTNANLIVQGETIRFGQNGRITLLPGPEKLARKLQLIARRLEFVGSPKRPFDIQATDAEQAEAHIAVAEVFDRDIRLDKRALWKRFSESLIVADPPTNISIKIGDEAFSIIDDNYINSMEWPLYFAAKISKHFILSPFSNEVTSELSQIISSYKPRLEKWRDPLPFITIARVRTAIERKTDLDGNLSSYTPKQDLSSQISDIRKLVDDDYFQTLINLIAATTKPEDKLAGALEKVRREISDLTQSQVQAERRIDAASTRSQIVAQELNSIDERIRQRSTFLAEMNRREYERLKDAQSVKQWTTVAAAAVVVAASFGTATPAVAAAAATGVSMTGEQIYRHNTGQPMTLANVLESGAKTYKAVQEFQKAWTEFKSTRDVATRVLYKNEVVKDGPPPESGKPDDRKEISKIEASRRLLASLAEAVDKAGGISSGVIGGATPLSLSERENEDEEMKILISKRAEFGQEASSIGTQIKQDAAILESVGSRLVDLNLTEFNLRSTKPENNQQDARWNANAYTLWRLDVERISKKLSLLKKSLYFETGQGTDGPVDVLEYPNELLSKIGVDILDPTSGVGKNADLTEMRANLEKERDKFKASVRENLRVVDDTLTQYFESRSEADTYRRSFKFRSDSSDPNQRAFLDALNGQIRQQIVGGTAIDHIEPAYIPIVISQTYNPYPERILDAKVVNVKFTVPTERIGERAFIFSTIHPGYGEMRRGANCFVGDFRRRPDDWRYFSTPLEQVTSMWMKQAPQRILLTKENTGRFYAFYPARSSYHMIVSVMSDKWRSIPRITEIEIGLEVMQ